MVNVFRIFEFDWNLHSFTCCWFWSPNRNYCSIRHHSGCRCMHLPRELRHRPCVCLRRPCVCPHLRLHLLLVQLQFLPSMGEPYKSMEIHLQLQMSCAKVVPAINKLAVKDPGGSICCTSCSNGVSCRVIVWPCYLRRLHQLLLHMVWNIRLLSHNLELMFLVER